MTDIDFGSGKRYFNPQQDMRDKETRRYLKTLRNYQDFMGFLYLSSFVPNKEKRDISKVILGMEKLRLVLESSMGYHPDIGHICPSEGDFNSVREAHQLTDKHPYIKLLYCIRQLFTFDNFEKVIDKQMRGGYFYLKWQQKYQKQGEKY